MAELDDDRDEEWFKEVYGREYTGPPKPPRTDNPRDDSGKVKKRPGAAAVASAGDDGSDEEDEPRDPNAVPTDFTSREAKVWEAKAKAVERNWKRRKEEELTCRICGEVGHFAQGCPTTLGGNRKQGEVIERIPLRDKRLKPRIIGTGGAVIQGIEKETGCRLKLEDNLTAGSGAFFVRISGPDRIAIGKAVDVVNKLVEQVEDEWKQSSMRRPHGGGGPGGNDGGRGIGGGGDRGGHDRRGGGGGDSYRGSNVNPLIAAQMQHIAVQRLQHSVPNMGPLGRGEGPPPPLDEDKRTIEHIASQLEARRQWEAVSGSSQTLDGSGASPPFSYKEGRGASGAGSLSSYSGKGSGSEGGYYHGGNQDSGPYQSQSGGGSLPELEQDLDLGYDEKPLAQTLDKLENRFLQETIELTKDQNAEEDKENAKHRERMKEIQEQYQQKMTILRSKHAKQREEFLRHESQIRQHQYQHQAGYGMYQYGGGNGPPSSRGGPYNGSGYDRGAHSASPENLHGHGHLGVYDSYKDGGPLYSNNLSHSYSRKQGYESSKNYGNQGYDSGPYAYGNSPSYSTYG